MIKRLLFSILATIICCDLFAQSISSNSPLCMDNAINLELKASGGSTYVWSGPNNFTSNQQNPVVVNPTPLNSGTYICVIDGKTTLNTSVKVGDIINPYIQRDFVKENFILDKEICSKGGSTVLISKYSDGSPFYDSQVTRQWYKDGVALPTSSNNQSTYTATEAGKYQVKIKTAQCEAISDPVTVKTVEKINPQYYFTVNGSQLLGQSNLKLCNEYSGSVEITGAISVSGNKKIYRDGIVVSDLSANQFSRVVTKQPGTYVLETTQGQCKSSDTLRFEYGKTTDVLVRKVDYISCANPTFYYIMNALVTPDNGITWTKDGVLVSSVNTVLPSGSGIYQAKFENIATGCKGESEKIKVVVPSTFSSDYIKIASHPTKKVTICKNSVNAKIISLNQFFQTGGTWKRDGKVHDAGSSFYQTKITQGGKYWYEYNNGKCITYSDTIEAVEEELPKFTLIQTCLKDNTVKLNVNSVAGAKYNWFQNGRVIAGKDTSITVSQLGKYSVEVFRNGCYVYANELNLGVNVPEITSVCSGDSLKFKALSDASLTYSWTGPNNFKSNLQNPIVVKATKGNQGFYKLSATDKGGCTFVAQTQVFVNDYPAFTLPKTVTACAGTEFIFNQFVAKPLTDTTETVSNYTFTAPNRNIYFGNSLISNVSSRDAGNYDVTVTGSVGGCVVKTSMELIVDASANCKSINLINYNNSRTVCVEKTAEMPFTITGTFKAGTDFRAYYEENYLTNDGFKTRKIILGTSKQSPIKMSGFKSNYSHFVKVESDDGVASLRGQYLYTSSVNSNYIVDANGNNRSAECTSLPLTLGSNALYSNTQWFLNGDTLKKETTRNIIASKTGTYTFKATDFYGCNVSFSKDIVIGKLDKPVIYNSSNELSCFNESIYLSTNQYYNNVKYTWKRDGILQSDNGNYIQATIAGKYVLEVIKETCKVNSDTITVKQSPDKNTNLSAYTYLGRDSNNDPRTFIYINGLGSSTYKFQLFKDNQLFAEGRDGGIVIKDAGKYFFKVVKGDCEAISDVIDYKGVNAVSTSPRNMSFGGNYDYTSNVIQLCDTNSVQTMYGYPDYSLTNVVRRVVTAFKDDKPLPTFSENSRVYPSLRFTPTDYNFSLYFRGAGTYYAIEEVTLKDSTKLKYRYNEMKVVLSSSFNIGVKTPQNIFACGDSVIVYGSTYNNNNQRAVSFTWKKDGAVFKKTTNQNDAGYLVVKQSGTYVLETTNKGGCIGISTPNKVELGKIGIELDTMSRTLCDGTTVMLNSKNFAGLVSDANGAIAGVSYQWQKDGKDYSPMVNLGSQDVYKTINLSTKEVGLYTLKAQQGKCQGVSGSVAVKALKVPNTINYADSVLFCQTQSVNLKTTEDATLSYLWERDGGFIKDASKATLEIKEAGIYRSLNRKESCWNYTPKVRAKVLPNILPTAILTGDKDINYADTAKVSIAFTSHAPWTFKLSDGKEYTATKSPFEVSLRPQFSTNYTLTEVKNVCGTGTISGTANIKVLVLSSELEQGIDLNVFPVPSTEDVNIQLVLDKPESMEWTLNNTFGNILDSKIQANKSTKHESSISLKSLPEGVYFLRIQLGEKALIRKIIKTN